MMSKGEGHGCTFFIELPLYARSTSADSGDNLIRKGRSLNRSANHDSAYVNVSVAMDGICVGKGLGSTRHVEVTGGRNLNSRIQSSKGIVTEHHS